MTQPEKIFARISIPDSAWIQTIGQPVVYAFGTAYSGMTFCFDKKKAKIFEAGAANEIWQNVQRLFPESKVEPCTYEEWIEQEAG